MAVSYGRYPSNWRKVARVIKRLAGYCCEECGQPAHSVHHKGVPFATGDGWRPGQRSDKHDLRRENLVCLCWSCHDDADHGALSFYASLRARGQARRAKHRALGVGTGLIPLRPIRLSSLHWYCQSRLHYALLRWSKRTGRSQYCFKRGPVPRVVESFLVKEVS
jgi:hypothetical protein